MSSSSDGLDGVQPDGPSTIKTISGAVVEEENREISPIKSVGKGDSTENN